LEFGAKTVEGAIASIATIESRSKEVTLAYDANTRYTRRLRTTDRVLYDLLDDLKRDRVRGRLPERTLIFATTFEKRPDDPRYNAAVDEFKKMFAITSCDVKEAAGRPSRRATWMYAAIHPTISSTNNGRPKAWPTRSPW